MNNPGYGLVTVKPGSASLQVKGADGSIRLSLEVLKD